MQYSFSTFTLHKLDGHIADIYLAEYSNSILLLDCGCRSDHKLIVQYITKTLNRPVSDLKLLVATHPHPDHIGSAMSLSVKYNIPVAASADINLWYKGFRGAIQHSVDTLLAHISARSRKMKWKRVSYPKKIHVNYPLSDLSAVPLFPDWQVYTVPGHTAHDIVLYNSRESFLYCSDTIVKIRDKFLSPFPVTDKIIMSESLTKIGKLIVTKIAMAHGGVFDVADFPALISGLKRELGTPLGGLLKFAYPLTLFPKALKKK